MASCNMLSFHNKDVTNKQGTALASLMLLLNFRLEMLASLKINPLMDVFWKLVLLKSMLVVKLSAF